MRPTDTRDFTHRYEAPANWDNANGPCGDLFVRVGTYGPSNIIACTSTWKPTAQELLHLNAGGVVEIELSVPNQCVMRAYVVDPVEAPKEPERHVVINEHAHGDDASHDYAYGEDLAREHSKNPGDDRGV